MTLCLIWSLQGALCVLVTLVNVLASAWSPVSRLQVLLSVSINMTCLGSYHMMVQPEARGAHGEEGRAFAWDPTGVGCSGTVHVSGCLDNFGGFRLSCCLDLQRAPLGRFRPSAGALGKLWNRWRGHRTRPVPLFSLILAHPPTTLSIYSRFSRRGAV